jgi:hypothetical protein
MPIREILCHVLGQFCVQAGPCTRGVGEDVLSPVPQSYRPSSAITLDLMLLIQIIKGLYTPTDDPVNLNINSIAAANPMFNGLFPFVYRFA